MFTRNIKPNADFYWMFLSSNNLKETIPEKAKKYIFVSEIENDSLKSCVSMDSFAQACYDNFTNNLTRSSTDSRELCTGRSLYDDTGVEEFYTHMNKVQGGRLDRKTLGEVLQTDKPTPMAKLLSAQISASMINVYQEKKTLGEVLQTDKPTPMAKLLSAQLSSSVVCQEKKTRSASLKRLFGQCFSLFTRKHRKRYC